MQPDNTTIIRATEQDIDLLTDLRILFAHDLAGKQDAATEARYRQDLQQYFSEELNKTYLSCYARVNGVAASVAGLVLRKQPGSLKCASGIWGYIMNVYTIPQYRRMGLSAQVMNALMAAGTAEWGIGAFELHATEQGEPGYQKLGFKIHPDQPIVSLSICKYMATYFGASAASNTL